ncbi:hypothetical protein GCM10010174_80740 [Kutzneria viridogrisea]|uniref:Uncharacterized protein n=1 Tax=Kutzneria viridogrisea TaxID=47990 RepID=A0ABR6BZ03_9PSEU|nr:hypothetical protein [Kutzneria viridogrisea]
MTATISTSTDQAASTEDDQASGMCCCPLIRSPRGGRAYHRIGEHPAEESR